jgi:hypothetical protein
VRTFLRLPARSQVTSIHSAAEKGYSRKLISKILNKSSRIGYIPHICSVEKRKEWGNTYRIGPGLRADFFAKIVHMDHAFGGGSCLTVY